MFIQIFVLFVYGIFFLTSFPCVCFCLCSIHVHVLRPICLDIGLIKSNLGQWQPQQQQQHRCWCFRHTHKKKKTTENQWNLTHRLFLILFNFLRFKPIFAFTVYFICFICYLCNLLCLCGSTREIKNKHTFTNVKIDWMN